MYLLRAVFIVGVLSMTAMATSYRTPEDAVKAYCTFDGEGAAYSSHQPHTRVFNDLQVNAVEAAWDESTIVKDYKIISISSKHKKTEVVVEYHVLGTVTSDLTLVSAPSNERVTFNVVRVGNKWKIDHSEIGPHITKIGFLAILSAERSDAAQKAQASPNDAEIKEVLAKLDIAIKQIQAW